MNNKEYSVVINDTKNNEVNLILLDQNLSPVSAHIIEETVFDEMEPDEICVVDIRELEDWSAQSYNETTAETKLTFFSHGIVEIEGNAFELYKNDEEGIHEAILESFQELNIMDAFDMDYDMDSDDFE